MKCPPCGVEIVWGLPTSEAWELFMKGQLDLRGCIVPLPGTPIFCNYCGTYLGGSGTKTPEEGRSELESLWRKDRRRVKNWGFKSLKDIRRYFDPESHKPDQLYQHHSGKQ
jgi:hypothetical protein